MTARIGPKLFVIELLDHCETVVFVTDDGFVPEDLVELIHRVAVGFYERFNAVAGKVSFPIFKLADRCMSNTDDPRRLARGQLCFFAQTL